MVSAPGCGPGGCGFESRRSSQISLQYAPVAQLDRASVFGTGGWGFESLQAYPLSYPAPCDKPFEIGRPRPLKSSKVVHYSQLRPSMPLRIANVYTLSPCTESDTLASPTFPPRRRGKFSIYTRAPATSLFHGLHSTGDGSRYLFPGYVQIRSVGMNRSYAV